MGAISYLNLRGKKDIIKGNNSVPVGVLEITLNYVFQEILLKIIYLKLLELSIIYPHISERKGYKQTNKY